jgi:hypothetical protein
MVVHYNSVLNSAELLKVAPECLVVYCGSQASDKDFACASCRAGVPCAAWRAAVSWLLLLGHRLLALDLCAE